MQGTMKGWHMESLRKDGVRVKGGRYANIDIWVLVCARSQLLQHSPPPTPQPTMTLILAKHTKSSDAQHDPAAILRNEPHPQYCGICGCPCLTPRLPTPQPDDPDSPLSPADQPSTPEWLHQFHHLMPSRGILPYPHDPHTATQPFQSYAAPSQHVVPIHLYCLRAVIDITKSGMYNCSVTQVDSMMVGWSVPRWTGFGPWVKEMAIKPAIGMGWTGLADQRARYTGGVEGSHLRSCALVSPTDLDDPLTYSHSSTVAKRAPQTSLLAAMPPHILTTIADNLLEGKVGEHQPAKQLDNLLTFCRSCVPCRELDLPEQTWRRLVTAAVDRFRDQQCQRWRANPSGVGGVTQVWIALDKMFVEPIEAELKRAERDTATTTSFDAEVKLSARDVLYWWLYSDAWRSRRRVWHSVVHACAAARNADWCEEWYPL